MSGSYSVHICSLCYLPTFWCVPFRSEPSVWFSVHRSSCTHDTSCRRGRTFERFPRCPVDRASRWFDFQPELLLPVQFRSLTRLNFSRSFQSRIHQGLCQWSSHLWPAPLTRLYNVHVPLKFRKQRTRWGWVYLKGAVSAEKNLQACETVTRDLQEQRETIS